jgi:hypothetical protein
MKHRNPQGFPSLLGMNDQVMEHEVMRQSSMGEIATT